MRLRRAKGSPIFRGFLVGTLLVVGVYVLFDLLDVDGSQLKRLPAREMILAADSEAPAQRFTRPDSAASGMASLLALALPRLSSPETTRGGVSSPLVRTHQSPLLPRLSLGADQGQGSGATGDPV